MSDSLRPLVLVTGGSRGLGKSLCARCRAAGAEVVEFSRSAPYPFSTALDLSRPETVPEAVAPRLRELAAKGWSSLTVVHNAGILDPIGPTWKKRPAALAANLNANLTGPVLFLAQVFEAFRELEARKVLVNISSGAALKGYPGWSLYCAAKAGMENHVRTLAAEQQGAAFPWLCLNVDPDVMDTEMQATIRGSSEVDFPAVGYFIQRKETGKLRAPSDVAEVVLRIAAGATESDQGARIRIVDRLEA